MTPDVNVLVAASRSDHPHHVIAREWLEQALDASAAGAAFTMMPMVLASFLRLVTSSRIFQFETPIEDAVAFLDALLGSPGVQLAALGPEWSKLRPYSYAAGCIELDPAACEYLYPVQLGRILGSALARFHDEDLPHRQRGCGLVGLESHIRRSYRQFL